LRGHALNATLVKAKKKINFILIFHFKMKQATKI